MSDEGLGLSCETCPAEATCIIAADGASSLACEDCWREWCRENVPAEQPTGDARG